MQAKKRNESSPSNKLKNSKDAQALARYKKAIEFIREELEEITEKVYIGSKYVQAKREAYQNILRILTGEE